MAVFVKGRRGTPLLWDKEGHVYYCNERHVEYTRWYWKCREYRRKQGSEKCSARAITEGNNVIAWKGQHNHQVIE